MWRKRFLITVDNSLGRWEFFIYNVDMEIKTITGLCILVWIFMATLILIATKKEERGSWAVSFWSSVITLTTWLIIS